MPFIYLDLSHNKFYGSIISFTNLPYIYSLSKSNNISYKSAHLKLINNRLSGEIPDVMLYAYYIDILSGNLFPCPNGIFDLPNYDPARHSYSCASQEYGRAVILVFVVIGISIIALSGRFCYSYYYGSSTSFSWFQYNKKNKNNNKNNKNKKVNNDNIVNINENENINEDNIILQFYHMIIDIIGYCRFWIDSKCYLQQNRQNETQHLSNAHRFIGALVFFRRLSIAILFVSIFLYLPIYLIFYYVDDGKYTTHKNSYYWVTTIAFLEGLIPVITLLVVWSVILIGVYVAIMHIHDVLLFSINTTTSSDDILSTKSTISVLISNYIKYICNIPYFIYCLFIH